MITKTVLQQEQAFQRTKFLTQIKCRMLHTVALLKVGISMSLPPLPFEEKRKKKTNPYLTESYLIIYVYLFLYTKKVYAHEKIHQTQ